MFVIIPKTKKDQIAAKKLVKNYDVDNRGLPIKDYAVIGIIAKEGKESELRLCEMAFQMNFRQDNKMICPFCEKEGKTDYCGHLIFTTVI